MGRGGSPSTSRGARRGAWASPPRSASWGSPLASAPGTASRDAVEPSTSSRVNRPGCSFWTDRIRPATAAPARLLTCSPTRQGTAPCVTTTRCESARRSSASQCCTTSRACRTASCTSAARSPSRVATSPPTNTVSGGVEPAPRPSRSAPRSAYGSTSNGVPRRPGKASVPRHAHRSFDGVTSTGASRVQSTRNMSSRAPALAAASRSAATGHMPTLATVATGAPVGSVASRANVCSPVARSRTRSVVAPAACRLTPAHDMGCHVVSEPASGSSAAGCRAASSSAGWMP